MMKLSDWLQAFARWFMRFSVVNLIWFLMNIPFWFSIWSWSLSDQKFSIYHYVLIFGTFMLIFVPTTVTLFIVVRDWIQQDSDDAGVLLYFKSFKQVYREGMKYGVFLGIVWLIWFIDLMFMYHNSDVLFMGFLMLGVFLFVFQVIFFCMRAHFDMTFKQLVKYSLSVVVGKPLLVLLLFMVNGLTIYIVLFHVPFLVPFFSGIIVVYLSFLIFNHWVNAIRMNVNQTFD